ncbi:MAG: Gfo/Idh/MocA family oxidoreductase [Cohnella sp.]|nr:Gfo/Idh/MocA family oxidoreductase [Cohnella sp.]
MDNDNNGNNGTFRTVIVGLGGITRGMMSELTAQSWFEPVGVVDVNEAALEEIGGKLRLPREAQFTDFAEALETVRPQLVIVNTPSRLHYAQTKAALLAGAHCLVAKPLTNSFEEAVELVRLAETKQLKLTVGQQTRYNRHYRAVKRFVQSGRLGTIESINFMNAKHRPVMAECTMAQPCLYEMSCHHFDSLMDAVPDYVPDWIFCDGFQPSWSPYNGPCMVNAAIVMKDGNGVKPPLHIGYHGGFSSQSHNYEYRLEGSEGVLRCRGIHMSNPAMTYEFAEKGKPFEPIAIDEGIEAIAPFVTFFEVWTAYMNGGEEPPFSGRNNLKPFALLCAGERSVDTKQVIAVADNGDYAAAFGRTAP